MGDGSTSVFPRQIDWARSVVPSLVKDAPRPSAVAIVNALPFLCSVRSPVRFRAGASAGNVRRFPLLAAVAVIGRLRALQTVVAVVAMPPLHWAVAVFSVRMSRTRVASGAGSPPL
jgi:hypothetical protein